MGTWRVGKYYDGLGCRIGGFGSWDVVHREKCKMEHERQLFRGRFFA